MKKSTEEIKKFDTFIYDKYTVEYEDNVIKLYYYYEIVGLKKFVHRLEIPYINSNINKEYVDKLAFNIGLLELISYWKATTSHNVLINCGKIDETQINFFKKIYYHGLGEFFYLNNLDPDIEDFMNIKCNGEYKVVDVSYEGKGSIIGIGGGKDSCVTLSLYKKENTGCFIINPKPVMLSCAYEAGYSDKEIIGIKRILDKGIIELNEEGYYNGHTPFSAMVAFVSYLTAYLNNKEYIVLSNENSANEANVVGTKINHQYSKSYEFEKDFQDYAMKYLGSGIKYYSFLRPLTEYQIGMLFSKYTKYHKIFKSCNCGSKGKEWYWCCSCAKCLFVYSLLSPYLYKEQLVSIFGEDMFEKEDMLQMFKELLGKENVKPFDCVGTFEEVNYAITKTIKNIKEDKLPFLLDYYKEHYYDEDILKLNLEHRFNEENSLLNEDVRILKEAINCD